MSRSTVHPAVTALLGVLLSMGYVCVTGILAMQIEGAKSGLGFDLLNRPTTIRDVGAPWLAIAGLAVVGLLTVVIVTRAGKHWTATARGAYGLGFSIPLLVVVGYAVMVTGPEHIKRIQRLEMLEGPQSWIDQAGNSTSAHLVLAIVIAWSVSQFRKRGPASTESTSTASTSTMPPADPSTGYQVN